MDRHRSFDPNDGFVVDVLDGLTVPQIIRLQREAQQRGSTLENRVKFFEREEAKMWRDLQDVHRHADKLEDGRIRILERRLAEKAIAQNREIELNAARLRAAKIREERELRPKSVAGLKVHENRVRAHLSKLQSQENLRLQHLQAAQTRFRNTIQAQAMAARRHEVREHIQQKREDRAARLADMKEQQRQEVLRQLRHTVASLPGLEEKEQEG